MNADEVHADQHGDQQTKYDHITGDWGSLPQEPCRFCHRTGGVVFQIDDGPEGRMGHQTVRCNLCGQWWYAGSSTA